MRNRIARVVAKESQGLDLEKTAARKPTMGDDTRFLVQQSAAHGPTFALPSVLSSSSSCEQERTFRQPGCQLFARVESESLVFDATTTNLSSAAAHMPLIVTSMSEQIDFIKDLRWKDAVRQLVVRRVETATQPIQTGQYDGIFPLKMESEEKDDNMAVQEQQLSLQECLAAASVAMGFDVSPCFAFQVKDFVEGELLRLSPAASVGDNNDNSDNDDLPDSTMQEPMCCSGGGLTQPVDHRTIAAGQLARAKDRAYRKMKQSMGEFLKAAAALAYPSVATSDNPELSPLDITRSWIDLRQLMSIELQHTTRKFQQLSTKLKQRAASRRQAVHHHHHEREPLHKRRKGCFAVQPVFSK